MHELGITQEIIEIVSEHSKGAKVTRVVLEIGKLSAILPDAVRSVSTCAAKVRSPKEPAWKSSKHRDRPVAANAASS